MAHFNLKRNALGYEQPACGGLGFIAFGLRAEEEKSRAVGITAPCSEVLTVLGSLPSGALSSVRRLSG